MTILDSRLGKNKALNVDVLGLKNLYRENAVAQALLDWFAERRNDSSRTNVDRVLAVLSHAGIPASRAAVTEIFRELERLGCGEYFIGRRGWRSRFEWKVSLVSVGQVAAGEAVPIEEVAPDPVADAEEEAASEMLQHTFALRLGLHITFGLPGDLTTTEATRLADFIKTLPFQP
jgi:hypothetical protein